MFRTSLVGEYRDRAGSVRIQSGRVAQIGREFLSRLVSAGRKEARVPGEVLKAKSTTDDTDRTRIRDLVFGLSVSSVQIVVKLLSFRPGEKLAQALGIVACSAEGAALCYRTICDEAPALMGRQYAS